MGRSHVGNCDSCDLRIKFIYARNKWYPVDIDDGEIHKCLGRQWDGYSEPSCFGITKGIKCLRKKGLRPKIYYDPSSPHPFTSHFVCVACTKLQKKESLHDFRVEYQIKQFAERRSNWHCIDLHKIAGIHKFAIKPLSWKDIIMNDDSEMKNLLKKLEIPKTDDLQKIEDWDQLKSYETKDEDNSELSKSQLNKKANELCSEEFLNPEVLEKLRKHSKSDVLLCVAVRKAEKQKRILFDLHKENPKCSMCGSQEVENSSDEGANEFDFPLSCKKCDLKRKKGFFEYNNACFRKFFDMCDASSPEGLTFLQYVELFENWMPKHMPPYEDGFQS